MIDQDAPEFISSFARGLAVIRTFGSDSARQTLTEVAEQVGITRATARRFLLTLCALGYARTDGKYFELTPQVLEIGYSYLSSLSISETIQPYLRQVTERLRESSSAAVLDGDHVVYVARSAARHRVMAIGLAVGARLPAHCTSMGLVLLAHLDSVRLSQYLETARLERHTDTTTTTPAVLLERLKAVRECGYALCNEELEVGLRSIAVPLHDNEGKVSIAMNVSAQAVRVSTDVLVKDYLPVLKEAAGAFEITQKFR